MSGERVHVIYVTWINMDQHGLYLDTWIYGTPGTTWRHLPAFRPSATRLCADEGEI